MRLSEKEMMQVSGGGYGIWAAIGGAITFLISIVEGFLNPSECNQ